MDAMEIRRLQDAGFSVQQLSDEHVAKLTELSARPSATEGQAWSERNTVGEFRRREGIVERRDHEVAEQLVAETRSMYRARFGRELDEGELAAVRRQAEMRAIVVEGGRAPASSWELAERHGWGVVKDPEQGSGMAMRLNGDWAPGSDPVVIRATEAAEEAKRLQAEADMTAWRRSPAAAGIGPAT